VTDIKILRLHYAETLKAWRELSLLKTLNAGETPGFLGFGSFE